jgi:xylan 1,4-beta-xylosidase
MEGGLNMEYSYELVRSKKGVPFKIFIHSVNRLKMHWHSQMEIILVLKGSINIRIGSESYLLKENDLILVNSNEIHNTSKTAEDNILIVLQVNLDHNVHYYPKFNEMIFDCKSFTCNEEEQVKFDVIRRHLAKIFWEINKKREGYQFIVGSEMNLLGSHLINNFEYSFLEDEKVEAIHKNIDRLSSIIKYIDENFEEGVTLQEVADNENLNVYYVSHFIKKNLGISFQEYINNKRLDKAVELLVNTNKTVTEIAFESGFSSTKSLNTLFNKTYNSSPSAYRKEKTNLDDISHTDIEGEKIKSKTYLDVDRTAAFTKLFKYLEMDLEMKEKKTLTLKDFISIDTNQDGIYHNFYWKKLTTFGRAAEGLRKNWQDQLKELQSEIGFEYIRFHGIFSDEMMVYNINDDGSIAYNWSYIDELFDFFKDVNIKPFIELGFMPSEIAKSDETMFWWRANISGPRDIKLWTDLVREFIRHCINRYGLKEVETWYFEVWNEPDLEHVFWIGGEEEYFKFYKETVLAIKSISREMKVGGPSVTYQVIKDGRWFEDFLTYCDRNKVPLDFVSLHIYPEDFSSKQMVQDIMVRAKAGEDILKLTSSWKEMKRIYFDENHTYDTLKSVHSKINQYLPYKPEIHITEWNSSSYGRNLIHDTCFESVFIIRNILKSIDEVNSIGYWTFTDIMEETKAGISQFHGGFGLINKDGLKKPSYFAYYLLSKLGEKIIGQGEEYIVTKNDDDVQILAYNFAYFDELFMNGDTSALTNTERYLVYEDKPPKEVGFNIIGVSGHYKVTRYKLNREHGSPFDEWVEMGAPENLTKEEIQYLKGRANPKISVEYMDIGGEYSDNLYIPVHGVELIILEKQI